jgi:hypothetical protein
MRPSIHVAEQKSKGKEIAKRTIIDVPP